MTQFARWEYHQGRDGEWYVRLRAANGRILVRSEGYTRKRDARRAALTIRTAAVDAVLLVQR